MNKSNILMRNVKMLHNKFGAKLHTDEQWLIAYWQQIDRIKMNDGKFEVKDILNNATSSSDILNTVMLFRVLKQMR
ncbi:hypothetical protein X915_gp108 [Bacillus phage vB_BanS-Tsamsa]|uniref:Uncharacterized protein n=1 Tax=Bacillus phage vB_BanS-Tsamsa TaxID=1308863 RepID=U5J9Z6_9CAUD|nr:hypothetical protein X915_gp108 [Bacillus phage vB_BanS-Tsamsa]AGI11920.1 hypothetical protein [Bacillus phage vB_BanS-Tsamsa]